MHVIGSIVDSGIVYRGTLGSRTASCCLGSICRLDDGTILASWRIGSSKDSCDGTIMMSSSSDFGRTWTKPWQPFSNPHPDHPESYVFNGKPGDLHFAPLTSMGGNRVLTGLMWLDRADPSRPMFNPATEGMIPVHTLIAASEDGGLTWSEPRLFDASPHDGLGAIAAPMFRLPSGLLACQYEINKPYEDPTPWAHRALLKFSSDDGMTWTAPATVAFDPTLRIRYWDQRQSVAPDGTLVAGLWAYDSIKKMELNFHLTESRDDGLTWSTPRDSGLSMQQPYPVFLSDGRMVAICIDRYRTRSIRAIISDDQGQTFSESQLLVYQQPKHVQDHGEHDHEIADQQLWTFGRVEAVVDPDNDVWVIHYGGDESATNIYWSRLRF